MMQARRPGLPHGIMIREAGRDDMPGISHVRISVSENLLTPEQLAARGITNESVAASFEKDAKGWVAVDRDRIVAFSIADRATSSVFALFVLPEYEGRGLGSRLLALAMEWLWRNGAASVWLTTGASTRAVRFYLARDFVITGASEHDDLRLECLNPDLRRPEQQRTE
jgi:GNAT superfamily N-acetyltransferase